MMLVNLSTGQASFNYTSDCNPGCQRLHQSCLITEFNPQYFPCSCYETQEGCMDASSPEKACLLEDGRVFGGEHIWNDYFIYKYHHTTTPPPQPNPPKPSSATASWLITYASIVSVLLMGRLTFDVIESVRTIQNRREYERIEAERVRAAGVPRSPESPYSQSV